MQLSLQRGETNKPSDSGQYGAALRWFLENLGGTELGFYYLNYHSRLPTVSGTAILQVPTAGFINDYFTEYAEDIHLWGASFNSTIGTWALAGEVSYRPNAPLQYDDVEVLFAGLTPLNPLLPSYYLQYKSQLGEFGPGEYIQGWERHKVWQAQATTTKLWGPNNLFKANQIAFVMEVGGNWSDIPSKDLQRYEGSGTDSGGGADWTTGDWNNPETQVGGFADDFSWGYRLATRFDYNNAIGAVTVSPRLGWAHDVQWHDARTRRLIRRWTQATDPGCRVQLPERMDFRFLLDDVHGRRGIQYAQGPGLPVRQCPLLILIAGGFHANFYENNAFSLHRSCSRRGSGMGWRQT